ncbi:MAG TPA: hypothetical protein VKB12_15230 [Pyrinomonadaceae bacterium]|nr:hypothetical protein [Pyrinomonadaceae bacterium]
MMMMPFSAFAYSMEMFREVMQGMQGRGGPGAPPEWQWTSRDFGGVAESRPDSPAETRGQVAGADTTNRAIATQQPTIEEEKNMSNQGWSGGDPKAGGRGWSCGEENWKVSDDCKDQAACDRLRLVRYKVLFLKNKLEAAFQEDEELVAEDITKDGFITWKIAEFVQKMERREIRQPHRWHAENNYPAGTKGGRVVTREGKHYVVSLPDKDKKYLRVYSEVLAWYDRERRNYERDKVDVLEEIRNALIGVRLHGRPEPEDVREEQYDEDEVREEAEGTEGYGESPNEEE